METPEPTAAERFLASMDERRRGWSRWRKLKNRIRWKVINPVRRAPRKARHFIQRGRRGWSDADAWGTDYYIARLNVEMLAAMRGNLHGYPSSLDRGTLSTHASEPGLSESLWRIAAIDAQIGYEGPDDGMERWLAMLTYFEDGWKAALRYINDWDEDAHAEFLAMLPLYGEWFAGLWD